MAEPRRLTLTVERTLAIDPGRPPAVARLSTEIEVGGRAGESAAEQVGTALRSLAAALDDGIARSGLQGADRPARERELMELVETYRPRQPELVDLLREEGEISPREHELLRQYMTEPRSTISIPAPLLGTGASAATATSAVDAPNVLNRPLAAAPAEAPRRSPAPRPVPDLLKSYRIETLRQAGAVRARRQITFEEYMAIKRYFSERGSEPSPASARPPTDQ